MSSVAAKKIELIEKVIALNNEQLLDAFLTALNKRETEAKETAAFQISEENLTTMANIAESDFDHKKYTSTADFLREIDTW